MENSKIKSAKDSVNALVALVESLRAEDGCPWDRKQTPKSMLVYLIEEIYELADAIESDDAAAVREELGDVLFHIVFVTRLYQEKNDFTIDDVARDITAKMIRRHPHVFGAAKVENTEQIRQNWYAIKQNEKKQSLKSAIVDSVPRNMPALMRAYQIGQRAARQGFYHTNRDHLMSELESGFNQLRQAIEINDTNRLAEVIGSYLLSLVNLARLLNIHPETALSAAVKTFEKHLQEMIEADSRT
ncbi:MAG: nucleoside triphosphate pyrophosphohydrolase [Desulfobacterales bacterium]|nr:nucleoside triphosphate pyrophosphohydrolase [Desulfobacterales bacterium]